MVQSLVRFAYDHTTVNGMRVPTTGTLSVSATARRRLAVPVTINLPDPFTVTLGAPYIDALGVTAHPGEPGVGWALVDVTDGQDFAYKTVEHLSGEGRFTRKAWAVLAQGSAQWVEYADQPDLTVVPVANVLAATKAYVDALIATVTTSIGTLAAQLAAKASQADLISEGALRVAGDQANSSAIGTKASQSDLISEGALRAAGDVAINDVLNGRLSDPSITAKIALLKQWAKNPDQLVAGAVTVDGSDLVTSAVVEWPDGKPGVLTITARQATTQAVTAYNVTHVDGATTLTYTQPAITRNANGAATLVPQITVA